jgi:hypothetical protein
MTAGKSREQLSSPRKVFNTARARLDCIGSNSSADAVLAGGLISIVLPSPAETILRRRFPKCRSGRTMRARPPTRKTAMTRTSLFAACVLTLLSGAAAAQSAPTFESLDKNSDGKISLNEASENDALFVAFKGLDKDKDGALSRDEFAAYRK